MNPGETYEAIAYMPRERLRALAERCLEDAAAEVVAPPQPALIMARVRETVDGEVFNLGEVLISTCDVTLDGEPGWGMVPGQDPERALCAAVVDAASRQDKDKLRNGLAGALADALAAGRAARRARWAAVQPTRVEFEVAKP